MQAPAMHRALARAVLYAVLPQMADESFDPKAEPYAYTRSQADLIDRRCVWQRKDCRSGAHPEPGTASGRE